MNQAERLRAFRANYPEKSLRLGGVEWKYRMCGAGARTLLMLPGGELVNDLGFDLVAALAPRFRIVYPAYPRVDSLDDLADGVAAILAAENSGRATVLGASFGGAVAQSMIRRHPESIERLILSNTGVPLAHLVRGRQIANAVLAAMPWPVLRGLMAKSILKLLGAPADELPFGETTPPSYSGRASRRPTSWRTCVSNSNIISATVSRPAIWRGGREKSS